MAEFEIHELEGTRFVEIHLDDEMVRAESGALSYLSGKIAVYSPLVPSIGGVIKSLLADQAIYRPTYTGTGVVTLESSLGGFHMLELGGESWILERGAYWASEDKKELSKQLDKLENAGVRMIGLTHRSNNQLAGSNEECRRPHHGLTDLGHFAVAEIWKRNMILDLAHASSDTIADVARLSAEGKGGPVIVSHTGIKSACDHDRNLSDEDLRNIVRSGGVASLGFWTTVNCFEGSVTAQEARQVIARSFVAAYKVLAAPEFAAEMGMGYDPSTHLALGSDFDGATLVSADASAIPWFLEGIATIEVKGRRVFDGAAIENIAGLDLLRLIQNALEES